MDFIPKVIKRERGDFVDSEEFNLQNEDLYSDVNELFELNMSLFARHKIMSTMLESAETGFGKFIQSTSNLPKINFTSDFIYPITGSQCEVSKFYGEIILGNSGVSDSIKDKDGLLRPEINVTRTSDNLIFTEVPESLTETSVSDIANNSDFPYLLRVRGVNERTQVRINIEATLGVIDFNSVSFVPYPTFGGTELRGITVNYTNRGVVSFFDSSENTLSFIGPATKYYKPERFFTVPSVSTKVSLDTRSDLYLASSDAMLLGINKIQIERYIFSTISYIGFRIPPDPGKKITNLKAITKWNNGFLGTITTSIYSSRTDFDLKTDNISGSFNTIGNGIPVSNDNELFVLVKIESSINTTPQLLGFDYNIVG